MKKHGLQTATGKTALGCKEKAYRMASTAADSHPSTTKADGKDKAS